MKRFFLITTKHLEEALWFRDDEDFAVGMNHVAIEAFLHKRVVVFVFILMSNHLHLILYGEREDVLFFINDLKSRYSHYYQKKYGVKCLLRDNDVHLEEINLDGEGFEWAAAYVMMNCVHANICAHPSQYPWGSVNTVFQMQHPSGMKLGELSGRGLRRFLHSGEDSLPKDWIINECGFILPQNYVPVDKVESRFRTPSRMNYFLSHSSKAKKKVETAENIPAFRDQSILVAIPDLIRSLFGKGKFEDLNRDEQTELLRQIRYRFSADITQAARACGITYSEAANLIDRA